MNITDIFAEHSATVVISLALLSFVAGFIDAVVGGGGLISLPAMLINMPEQPLLRILGTGKIAALCGTSVAAYQYSKRIKFDYKLLLVISFFAFVAAYSGAKAVSFVNVDKLKPVILVILILIAIYTFIKKDLGSIQTKQLPQNKQVLFGSLLGTVVGFYDGFFGPGTGSFFVLGFVVILGFEFIQASAYSKFINCITNISALVVFIKDGNFMLGIAILMAVFNITGSIVGSRIAMKKGNGFVRIIFLVIVSVMIFRYGYDIFLKN